MFAYRERRLRAFDHAGAAEVKFLTAGNAEFKADLRDERAGRVEPCSCGAYGANEGLGMPVLSNTGNQTVRATLRQLRPATKGAGHPPERSKGDGHRHRDCNPNRSPSWGAPRKLPNTGKPFRRKRRRYFWSVMRKAQGQCAGRSRAPKLD